MRVFIFLISLLITLPVWAQEDVVEKTYPFTNQFLDVDLDLVSDLVVTAWDKQEIYVKITYEVNDGKDNEAVIIDIDDYGDRLSLDLDFDVRKLSDSDDCCCGENRRSYRDRGKGSCLEVKVEVMIPASAQIGVETITSSVTINGMISDIEIETVTGVIDLTWQSEIGAEISMKTVTGDLYTNMDFDTKKEKGLPNISSRRLKSIYKDGEKEVRLKTVTGAIYFRKVDD